MILKFLKNRILMATLLFTVIGSQNALATEICTNEIDDDNNGRIDCDDPICGGTWICLNRVEHCFNGVDDDKNGEVDCDDYVCKDTFLCTPRAEYCANGVDDDGDGDVDCADDDCLNTSVCLPYAEICTNDLDDDGDGDTDCEDAACKDTAACLRKGSILTAKPQLMTPSPATGITKGTNKAAELFQNKPITISCDEIVEPTTLENRQAPVDYIIPNNCVLVVSEDLTIEPGTVINFEAESAINVQKTGKLNLSGTSQAPIVLAGTENQKGWWRGVHIEGESQSLINHTSIADAGGQFVDCCEAKASVFIKSSGDNATLVMQNTVITNGSSVGIYAAWGAVFSISDSTITDHDGFPVSLDFKHTWQSGANTNALTGNKNDQVYVRASTLSDNQSFKKLNIPYRFEGKVFAIESPLKIAAGTSILFEANGGLSVRRNGSLNATGRADRKISFAGIEDIPGYWRGISITTRNRKNQLQHIVVSGAGSTHVECCNEPSSIYIKRGNVEIRNSEITNGSGYGIYVEGSSELVNYSSNSISGHSSAPLHMPFFVAKDLDGTASSYLNNQENFIAITNDTIEQPITVKSNNIPFRISDVLSIASDVVINAGTHLEFDESGGISIFDKGSLSVEGTKTDRVLFSGIKGQKSGWRGIYSVSNSSKNKINHADIVGTGDSYVRCCYEPASIYAKAGRLDIQNSRITNSLGCGIRMDARVELTQSGNQFLNNAGKDLCE